jgi:plastocyanin
VVMSRWVVLILVVMGLVVAGCGEDEETPQGGGQAQTGQAETGQATEPSKPASQTVKVSATDFAFDPANPRVKAGVVRFQVTNDGQAPHALEVEAPGGEVETEVLQPGQSGTVEADLSEEGSVTIYCPVGNHRQMGMEGEIRVGGGGSAAAGDDSGGGKSGQKEEGDDSGGGGSYGY